MLNKNYSPSFINEYNIDFTCTNDCTCRELKSLLKIKKITSKTKPNV